MSNSNPNYFRLGLFVLAAIGALIALILIFGSGQIFQKTFEVETYIKQSVTGLDNGASVRFRGVKVGQVISVGLTGEIYEKNVPMAQRKAYVIVRMLINGNPKEYFGGSDSNVAANLRARVKTMGITGVNYIELDFEAPNSDYPTLAYTWKPEYPVIPSLPSPADEIFTGLQKVVSNLSALNLVETQQKFDSLVTNLNTVLAGSGKGNQGIAQSVQELNTLLAKMNSVTSNAELELLTQELVASSVVLRQMLSSMQGDTAITIENLKQASEQLNDLTRIASRSPSSLIWGEPPARIQLPANPGATGVQK
ncbi:MlaD family protein [Polynucleobacter sp.]|jgi:ABC-type transporter Mla subunit MlaD|uniref:MlaD family protein n=1 Tax=Polynucleobacter sp. TaxID=2029855 RepID=UPI0027374717|nr:MlaD family protein [Polynucleobacter sp.]MDP3121434.1 MlaD family protein [Polynucleobacter sp.]